MKSVLKFFLMFIVLLSTVNAQIVLDYEIKAGMVFSKHEYTLKRFREKILIQNIYESYRLGPTAGFHIRYFDWPYSEKHIS